MSVKRFDSLAEALLDPLHVQEVYLSWQQHEKHLLSEIGQLENLQRLTLTIIGLVELPGQIVDLKHLVSLDLHNNYLPTLPDRLATWCNCST